MATPARSDWGPRVLLYLHGEITAEALISNTFYRYLALLDDNQPEEAKRTIEAWLREEHRPATRGTRSHVFEAFSLLGHPRAAIKHSRSYIHSIGMPMGKMGAFYEMVDRYVCGGASAENLLAAADESSTRRRHRIHAHFLVALERLSRGDRQEAMKHFEEIEQAGSYVFHSRPWAAVLLKRLREDRKWPRWIPAKDAAAASQK